MKKSIQNFLMASSMAMAIPFSASAGVFEGHSSGYCPHMEHHSTRPFGQMPEFMRGVKLSEEQQDKVFEIIHEQEPKMRSLMKTVRKTHAEIESFSTSDGYTDEKAEALADKHTNAMNEMAKLRMRTENKLLKVMTPDQIEKSKNRNGCDSENMIRNTKEKDRIGCSGKSMSDQMSQAGMSGGNSSGLYSAMVSGKNSKNIHNHGSTKSASATKQ